MVVLFLINVVDIFMFFGGMLYIVVFRLFGIYLMKLVENLFWVCIICFLIFFIDIFLWKKVLIVKYLLCWGLYVVIMFLVLNIFWISCVIVSVWNCVLFCDVSGVKLGIKKCNCGKGIMLIVSFFRLVFSCFGNFR